MKKSSFVTRLNKYIHKKLTSGDLNDDEMLVLIYLMQQTRPVRQWQVAQELPTLGSYERYEDQNSDTTKRKVRGVIRDLRVIHGIPVMSSPVGYWLPITETEIVEFVEHLEIIAKAQTKAYFQTYRSMKKLTDVTSNFFEELK